MLCLDYIEQLSHIITFSLLLFFLPLLISGTYVELHLIRWLMGNDIDSAALEFIHIFNTAVTYKVTISDKSSPLVVPEFFTIQGKI